MAKFTPNRIIGIISGKVGDLIYYEADGQTLIRRAPEVKEDQKPGPNSDRFKAAGDYATKTLADPAVKAAYLACCRGHQNPRNLAIRDAMRPPVIDRLNLEEYTGKAGQPLRAKAHDDFKVAGVQFEIRDPQGTLIEEGAAEWNREKDEWCYLSRMEVPSGQTVSVTAIAADLPKNTLQSQCWHFLKPA